MCTSVICVFPPMRPLTCVLDCSKNLIPPSQPIRGKTKTKCGSIISVFPRFRYKIFPPLQVLTLSSHWFFQMLSFIRIEGGKFQSEWRRAHARYVSLETLYGGQFTLSTELIKPNYLVLTGLAHSCFSLHLIG